MWSRPRELSEHRHRLPLVARLAVDTAIEVHRRVDAERHPAGPVDGAGLPRCVLPDEGDGVCVGRVVLHVRRRLGLERDLQLLEDRPPLRRGRREHEPHACLTATQISSAGHLRAHSAENAV